MRCEETRGDNSEFEDDGEGKGGIARLDEEMKSRSCGCWLV